MAYNNGLREKDFPKGTRIRVRINGTVQENNRDFDVFAMESTSLVRETGTDMAWTQFLFLSSSQVGGGKAIGDTVTAEFDARVTGEYGTGSINTTRVREINNGGLEYQHFLFLPSTGISIVKECAVCQGPLSPVNSANPELTGYVHENDSDDTHVPVDPADPARGFISAARAPQYSFGAAAPTFATAGVINSETVDEAIKAGLSDLDAERARVARDYGLTAANSLTVDPDGNGYSFDTAPDREETPVAYKKDDKIRIRFTARVGIKPEPGMEACTAVQETEGAMWTHYLYLGSAVIKGTKNIGDTVTAEFDAQVVGEIGAAAAGTTRVKEIRSGGGFIHYVYLNSGFVSAVTAEAVPLEEALKPYVNQAANDELFPLPSVNPGARISINDTEILSARVIDRIAELEDALKKSPVVVAVVRTAVRAGQNRELGAFDSYPDAEEFILREDFDRQRVTLVGKLQNLNVEDTSEVNRLRQLSIAGASIFGGVQWANGVVLQCAGFFDDDWAKSQAADELNIDSDDVDSWPLDLVDWDEAAGQRRDSDYLCVRFDDEPYFGVSQ
jgi:hypothetical protein